MYIQSFECGNASLAWANNYYYYLCFQVIGIPSMAYNIVPGEGGRIDPFPEAAERLLAALPLIKSLTPGQIKFLKWLASGEATAKKAFDLINQAEDLYSKNESEVRRGLREKEHNPLWHIPELE